MKPTYHGEDGRTIHTAEDVMMILVELGDDFDVYDLPPKGPLRCPRTTQAQAIVDHVHSGNYKKGDTLYNEVVKVHNYSADMTCRLSASIVYEHYNEPSEAERAPSKWALVQGWLRDLVRLPSKPA